MVKVIILDNGVLGPEVTVDSAGIRVSLIVYGIRCLIELEKVSYVFSLSWSPNSDKSPRRSQLEALLTPVLPRS